MHRGVYKLSQNGKVFPHRLECVVEVKDAVTSLEPLSQQSNILLLDPPSHKQVCCLIHDPDRFTTSAVSRIGLCGSEIIKIRNQKLSIKTRNQILSIEQHLSKLLSSAPAKDSRCLCAGGIEWKPNVKSKSLTSQFDTSYTLGAEIFASIMFTLFGLSSEFTNFIFAT